jgi:hypothetical protein
MKDATLEMIKATGLEDHYVDHDLSLFYHHLQRHTYNPKVIL